MARLPRIERRLTESFDLRSVRNFSDERMVRYVKVGGVRSLGVRDVVKIKNTTFANCSFAQQVFKGLVFQNCNFYNCVFNGSIFLECEFHDCAIVESVFFKTVFEMCYIDPRSFVFRDRVWLKNYANVNAWLYWGLYKNSKTMHQEKFAMLADRKFRLSKRYEYLYGRKPDYLRFFKGLVYDWGLGSGYGIVNSIVVTLLILSLFSFFMFERVKESGGSGVNGVLEVIYYSVVSFTTVGYGDYLPIKDQIALSVTMIFLLLSVIWGAIVTAIVVKRIVR
ncbi:ion channel [Pseudomonas sp. PSKL.D1]|uniref:ion channel n=1 Tax=Pseudomonas sp. PSKL.D1 TaxID=3029060 RepID=UPI0023814B6C|nr:ion channel [Pseudomonas sp. PSKL.D1]WDY56009.1 ion channel [Pseudomonas sp. PSKL.D1]